MRVASIRPSCCRVPLAQVHPACDSGPYHRLVDAPQGWSGSADPRGAVASVAT